MKGLWIKSFIATLMLIISACASNFGVTDRQINDNPDQYAHDYFNLDYIDKKNPFYSMIMSSEPIDQGKIIKITLDVDITTTNGSIQNTAAHTYQYLQNGLIRDTSEIARNGIVISRYFSIKYQDAIPVLVQTILPGGGSVTPVYKAQDFSQINFDLSDKNKSVSSISYSYGMIDSFDPITRIAMAGNPNAPPRPNSVSIECKKIKITQAKEISDVLSGIATEFTCNSSVNGSFTGTNKFIYLSNYGITINTEWKDSSSAGFSTVAKVSVENN